MGQRVNLIEFLQANFANFLPLPAYILQEGGILFRAIDIVAGIQNQLHARFVRDIKPPMRY
jgi:hypothetical protein